MLLAEPPESDYDLRFQLLGFPIRITWSFWLLALVFGYNLVQGVDNLFLNASPGPLPLLVLWTAAVLVSILIHELGHAVAFRLFGIRSSIVLYHFGGLAIPSSGWRPVRSRPRSQRLENIVIAVAGPVAQLLLAAAVIVGVRLAGYQVLLLPEYVAWIPGVRGGEPIVEAGAFAAVNFVIFPSIHWAILNLAPVWPLDGGRISRELVLMSGGTLETAHWSSVLFGGICAVLAFQWGQLFLAILFASLAASSYQMLSTIGPWQR
ncbi:site-2 protease family protein [Candidatus Laterigemmans baculatus]|uniref:site-2 protease family protein n=1 Tax=Candidatus Laterigemmans baculatus TaxID=2770505 RepID=UPI0013DB76DD|nr:site-2 protease family protein [Candidatus Laterigemmans baculatus]